MISIAMTTYNGAKYIKDQIDSILKQSFSNFELIICDDNSVDGTWELLEEFVRRDKRIKIYKNNKNLGFKRNFEQAIRMCKGDFIALSDQDDIWFPDHLNILFESMKDYAQIVCGRPLFVDENNNKLPHKFDYFKMDFIPSNNEDMARHIFLGRSTFQGASMLIRKSFFDLALPIPQRVNYHDSWFAALACFTGGLIYVDKPIMRYRRYKDSITFNEVRVSPARTFLGALLVNHALKDRLPFVEAIVNRVTFLTNDQKNLLNIFKMMIERRSSMMGRILNLPYLIKYFKPIYTYDGKHLFS